MLLLTKGRNGNYHVITYMERNDVIQIRVSAEEKQAFADAASEAGKTISQWIRESLLLAAPPVEPAPAVRQSKRRARRPAEGDEA